MNNTGFLIIAIVLIAVIFYGFYITIIKRKNKALEAFSDIDVQLKKRFDLIPNLVAVAKKYMEHEKETFTIIAQIRSQFNNQGKSPTQERFLQENSLALALQQLMLKVENYPTLKADQEMTALQRALVEIEEHIAAARRFYNSAVNELNNSIKIFPGNMLASFINIVPMEYFSTDIKDTVVPSIDFQRT